MKVLAPAETRSSAPVRETKRHQIKNKLKVLTSTVVSDQMVDKILEKILPNLVDLW